MKLPRDLSGADLVKALARIGYRVSHQMGSHIRVTLSYPGDITSRFLLTLRSSLRPSSASV